MDNKITGTLELDFLFIKEYSRELYEAFLSTVYSASDDSVNFIVDLASIFENTLKIYLSEINNTTHFFDNNSLIDLLNLFDLLNDNNNNFTLFLKDKFNNVDLDAVNEYVRTKSNSTKHNAQYLHEDINKRIFYLKQYINLICSITNHVNKYDNNYIKKTIENENRFSLKKERNLSNEQLNEIKIILEKTKSVNSSLKNKLDLTEKKNERLTKLGTIKARENSLINRAVNSIYLNDFNTAKEFLLSAIDINNSNFETWINLLLCEYKLSDIESLIMDNNMSYDDIYIICNKTLNNEDTDIVKQLSTTIFNHLITLKDKILYDRSIDLIRHRSYEKALKNLEQIKDYKDFKEQIKLCNEAIKHKDKIFSYHVACKFRFDNPQKALDIFNSLGDYRNSKILAKECEETIKQTKNESSYNKALSLYNDDNFNDALIIFEQIKDYSDSKIYIEKCNDIIQNHLFEKAIIESINYPTKSSYKKIFNKMNKEYLQKLKPLWNIKRDNLLYEIIIENLNNNKFENAIDTIDLITSKDIKEDISKIIHEKLKNDYDNETNANYLNRILNNIVIKHKYISNSKNKILLQHCLDELLQEFNQDLNKYWETKQYNTIDPKKIMSLSRYDINKTNRSYFFKLIKQEFPEKQDEYIVFFAKAIVDSQSDDNMII